MSAKGLLAWLVVSLAWALPISGQNPDTTEPPPATKQEFRQNYQERITQKYLNGVYIPKNLDDALAELDKRMTPQARQKFRAMSEEQVKSKVHFSFGRWMIRNWGFYEGSRLSHYVRSMKIYHPDDMARFLILAYHRHVNDRPLQLKSLIQEFQQIAEQRRQRWLQEGNIIHEETRKRDQNGSF